MTLSVFAASTKRKIYEELCLGFAPSVGSFVPELLRDAKDKGEPQMGTTVFAPDLVTFEYIYPGSLLFSVSIIPPQRIVFMPVPSWVVETIWQGEIAGSYHFESDAEALVTEFRELLSTSGNAGVFGAERVIGKN